jgi:3-oxoadipate enol-lactonase
MKWREAGSSTGEPVILLHGFPFDSSMWDLQLAEVPEGWRYIAPDLRGFGRSPLIGEGPLTMSQHAADVVALMDELNIDQAVICGLSMGGYVALSLVMNHPDRVRALVLVASRANADGPEAKKGRLQQAAKVRQAGVNPVVDSMLPKLLSAHSRMKLPDAVEHVRAMMEGTPAETMARALEGMAAREDYTSRLGEIGVSTIVVRGQDDEIIPAGDMELIARTVRGARHEMVPLTGHLPNLEAPDVFNSILSKFLQNLPPALKLGDLSLSF